MIGKLLCDADLRNLTRVSRRLRAIGCPQYLRRKGVTESASRQSLRVHSDGFKALGMWRQSPGFSAQQILFCNFNFDPTLACLEIPWLLKFFISLPSQPSIFFRCICFYNIQTQTLQNLLDLLKITVHRTRCRNLDISGMSFQDGRWRMKGRQTKCLVLEDLEELEFQDCNLAGQQWMSLLSKLRIPSLRELTIVGETSMVAVYHFLCRHPDVRIIHFRRCTAKDVMPSSSGDLRLPHLWSLKGLPLQLLDLLRSLPSQPAIGKLVVESILPTTSPQDTLFNQVLRCLTLCKGHLALEISLTKEASIAELMRVDVCIPIDLRGTTLPCTISTLCIEYEDVCDESILVCYISEMVLV